MRTSAALIVLIGERVGDGQLEEIDRALGAKLRVIPVLAPGVLPDMMPQFTRRLQALSLGRATDADLSDLVSAVQRVLNVAAPEVQTLYDPDEPQKGRWGGQAASNGRLLSAKVSERSADWYAVTLSVTSSAAPPITGPVEFHLHPTLVNETVVVEVNDGKAELTLECWGAFTVGAVAHGEQTRLELDLAQNASLPERFRER